MSTTIDQRVVEMRFDNKQFESGVSTTMSTLDKLKQKLNFGGASKGLEEVSASAKNVNMSGLGTAVDAVQAKFSALSVVGVTALANLTNSAVNAGKRMVSALTIDPIKSGFSEYETQINAVQTILANTSSKGTTLNDVNTALDTLNAYADKTIYNFTEMTRNIGTFTAAGVDLDTSVSAIQGIANLAAVSGSTSQQASTAMYQLSQALSSGTVKLMDWNSVVNAGMGGEVFQNALKETARIHGVAIDEMIKSEGSFRETLSKGWLTSDILTETLNNFTMAAEEGSEEWNNFKKSLMDRGYTEAQAAEILKMANTATDAATKVKTFTQLWDTLKEAAQSGWTQTWEIVVGDFEEAKELFTSVSDTIGNMINASSESRNKLLEDTMVSNWDKMIGKIEEAGISSTSFEEKLTEVLKSHGKDVTALVTEYGSLEKAFTSGAVSSDILKEAVSDLGSKMVDLTSIKDKLSIGSVGDDVKKVQEVLSNLDYDIGTAGIDGKFGPATEKAIKEFQELQGLEVTGIIDQATLDALDSAQSKVGKLSDSVYGLVDDITRLGGRELLIESLKNVFEGLKSVVIPVKEAFREVFPPITSQQLYGFIEGIKNLTEKFKLSESTADKLKRVFKGVFSIFDIGRKIVISIGKAFGELLGSDGVSNFTDMLLEAAASLGDFFTSLNKSFDTGGLSGILTNVISGISNLLFGASEHMKSFGDVFSFIGNTITKVATGIGSVFKTVFGWISENISIGDVFAGLAGGGLFAAGAGIFKLGKGIPAFLEELPDKIKEIFGFGGDGEGIISKFKNVLDSAKDALSSFATGIKISSLVSIAIAVGILSASMRTISELNTGQIVKSLVSIGVMLGMLGITMKSLTKTLSSFGSKGLIKAGVSLIAVAAAVSILAGAMKKISDLSIGELAKSLIGLGIGLGILVAGLKGIGKTKISLSTSVAILALAESCDILADALLKFAQMSWGEIGRGLTAMGGALTELVIAMSVLNKFGGGKSIYGSVAILITVQSLSKMADGLKKFAQMSWDEIGRGLAAMGGALAELSIALTVVGKIAGFSSVFAAGAIFIVTQGLDDMAEALSMFADMSWSEIGRGLTAMGGALVEVGAVLVGVGKIAGFSSIFAAGAIFLVIQSLGDLADVLQKFGWMSWDEIGRGLTAMGGALTELGVVLGGLGVLAGFSSIFAAGSILIVIQGLDDLANALSKFGQMSWSEIGTGLVAMGGALIELGVILGGLGVIAGFSSIFAAGSILIVIQGLDDLANALTKFGQMTWDEIGRGLVGMGGALTELAVITGVLGTVAGLPALLGGGAILLAVQSLGELATSFKQFGEMSWDEIDRGLTAMGGALGELALGGFANTIAIIGDLSIATVAKPLGTLADSIMKWTNVTVPEGLAGQLSLLAGAVSTWTFSAVGAGSIAVAASPLGTLADSVLRWTGVTVPEGLAGHLSSLAGAVADWTFSGIGAASLTAAAPAVGDLADAVKKWSGVVIPEGLKDGLIEIAEGVKAFTWAFMGGWSMDTLTGPLGDLATSVKKWNGVSIPDDLGEDLTILADGIKAFSWAFLSGWSMGAVTGPLGELADSVKKWNGVSIPENLGDDLAILADGVKSFSWAFVAGWSLGSLTGPLGDLATSVKKWSNVVIPANLGDGLRRLSSGVRSFSGITDISVAVNALGKISNSAMKLSNINFGSISSGLNSLTRSIKNLASIGSVSESFAKVGSDLVTNIITPIKNASHQFVKLGSNIAVKLSDGVKSRKPMIVSNISSVLDEVCKAINSKQSLFNSAGKKMVETLISGISGKTNKITATFVGALTISTTKIKQQRSKFESAGRYLGDGLVIGINSKKPSVYRAAYALGQKAVQGEKDGQASNSPSKLTIQAGHWLGEGLIIGMKEMGKKVYKSGAELGTAASSNISDAIRKLSTAIDMDIDSQPTIRPVMDLSDIKAGMNTLGGMMDMGATVGVTANIGAISTMMNRRNQNGANDDVVSELVRLGKKLDNVGGDSYSIGNVNYQEGSDVAEALKTIIRAATKERRS